MAHEKANDMLAPWLVPTDVIGAASRGASLGLQARSQDTAESNAADRLRMAYDQMASEERRQSAQAAQALMIKQQEQQALNAYRQGELEVRRTQAENLKKHYEDQAHKLLAAADKPIYKDVAGALLRINPSGTVETVVDRPTKEPSEEQKAGLALRAGSELKGFDLSPPDSPGGIMASNIAYNVANKYSGLPKKLDTTKAKEFLDQAGGDKKKARQLAKDAGYIF